MLLVTNTITNNNQLTNGAGYVDGSGTANYVPKWTDGDSIGNSVIYDYVGIGTGVPTVQVVGNGLFTGNVGLGIAAIGNKRLTIYEASSTSLVLSNSNNFVNIFNGSTVGDPTSIFSNVGFKFATASDASATGFSEKMRIDSAGNVGIGTTSPDNKFHVVGGADNIEVAQFTGAIETRGLSLLIESTTDGASAMTVFNSQSGSTAKGQFDFRSDGTSRMLINRDGNIGIGTGTIPFDGLRINGTGSRYLNITSGNGATAGILFGDQSDTFDGGIVYSNGDQALIFYSADAERMRIDSSGNVGIGTSSPASELDIASSAPVIRLTDLDVAGLYSTIEGNAGAVVLDADSGNVLASSTIRFRVDGGERMRIDSSGNVGIGTSSPSRTLDVNGEIQTTSIYSQTYRSGRTDGDIYIQASTSSDFISLGTQSQSNLMRIQGDGKVGIGTSSPSTKFEVNQGADNNGITLSNSARGAGRIEWELSGLTNGGHKFIHNNGTDENVMWYSTRDVHSFYTNNAEERMRLEADGDLHVDGDVIAYSTTISDQRLKDDVQTIDNALDKVSNLRGVSYTWNNGNRKGQKDLGLIAQEVEQVLPELVREKEMPLIDGGTYKTVDYEKIVGVLIEAVKELTDKVNKLEAK
jgi:hypothetical protein